MRALGVSYNVFIGYSYNGRNKKHSAATHKGEELAGA